MDQDNKHLWDQFAKLGDMMGDGLHHESDGRWISREYKRLAKILVPEIKEAEKEKRIAKNKIIDQKISALILNQSCIKCSGDFEQTRSGSKIIKCKVCGARFKAITSKDKKC